MENVTFISVENPDGSITEHAIIAHTDGGFTSMPKSVYDTLPSNSSIPQAGE
jgi:hypothetical protein